MSLLMKMYKTNHKIVENVSPYGTGMGGNLFLDFALSNILKYKNLSESERDEYERIQKNGMKGKRL